MNANETMAQGGFILPEQMKSPEGEATNGSGTQKERHDKSRAFLSLSQNYMFRQVSPSSVIRR